MGKSIKKNNILIHAPNLETPGGKQTYYAAVKSYFQSDISFFFYGAQGKKESKFRTLSRLFSDYRDFNKEVKSGKYDLVHLNPSLNLKSFFRDSIFAWLSRRAGVKTLVFWHGWNWDFEKKYVQKLQGFFRFFYGKTDAMMVLAKEFEAQLRAYGYQKPIHLETTVVDNTIFNLVEEKSIEYLPKKNESLVLLFLARLERVKGIYEAIDSFRKLKKKHPNIILNVAGTGGALDEAKAYVAAEQIEGINFLGWITGEQKAQAFLDAHIYILASYHGEGMPISLLEAMSTGKSVVTTDVGGIKDFFQDSKMGYFVKAKDTQDLEHQLDRLISNPALLKEFGQYNRAYAERRFTPQQVTPRIEEIYFQTINSKPLAVVKGV